MEDMGWTESEDREPAQNLRFLKVLSVTEMDVARPFTTRQG